MKMSLQIKVIILIIFTCFAWLLYAMDSLIDRQQELIMKQEELIQRQREAVEACEGAT